MGASSHPTPTPTRPAGCPIDTFGGHPIYPVPAPCEAFPWGVPVSLLVIPLVMTASHLLYDLEGRFWLARRAYGGTFLHAGLTRDGWITANGSNYSGPPALMVAAAAVVEAWWSTGDHLEECTAARLAAIEAQSALRPGGKAVEHG